MAGRVGLKAVANKEFEKLALPLLGALYSHAYWLARDHAEAEDLVQETLAKALRGFGSFAMGTNFKAWIFKILRNSFLTSRTGLAVVRTESIEDQAEGFEVASAGATPEEILIRADDEATLYAAMEQLTTPLREVLLLCDVEEMKYREIAFVLEVPVGTVMSRISRARVALRELLMVEYGRRA